MVAPVEEGKSLNAENAALPSQGPAADMLRRAIRLLAESEGDTWVHKASVWPMIKRLDPTFSTKDYGFTSFSEMLKALDVVVEIKKGEKDHLVRLR
ncbi:OST-HTH/LOTUS domain-containing protein [Cupriavidus basilensis]